MFVELNRHIKMRGNMRVKRLKILEPTLRHNSWPRVIVTLSDRQNRCVFGVSVCVCVCVCVCVWRMVCVCVCVEDLVH
jgi:hypothetical protein